MRNSIKRTLTGPIARGVSFTPLPGIKRAPTVGDGALALAEMIQQADRDTSGGALRRLLLSTEYGQLFWGMRDLGEYLRREAGRNLYAQYGDTRGIIPDPRAPLPYRARTVLLQVCRDEGVERLTMNQQMRHVAQDYGENRRMIYAWIQTYEGNRPATLIADPEPLPSVPAGIHEDRWTWQAAQVLGVYFYAFREYHGAMTPGAAILPPDPYREPTRVALAHQFAKALLNLDSRCAESSRCSCNWLLDMARRVPAAHPQQTGELRRDDLARRRPADTPRPRAQTAPDLTRDPSWRQRPSAPSDSAPHITPEEWRRLRGVADDLDAYDEPPTARDDEDPAS